MFMHRLQLSIQISQIEKQFFFFIMNPAVFDLESLIHN